MTAIFQGKRRSPLVAIRAYCVWCCGGSSPEVAACPSGTCPFHPYRLGSIPPGASRSLVRVIKAKCADCRPEGAKDCDAYMAHGIHEPCPCWPFRLGRNPNVGKEQRAKLRAHGKRLMNFTGSQAEIAPRVPI